MVLMSSNAKGLLTPAQPNYTLGQKSRILTHDHRLLLTFGKPSRREQSCKNVQNDTLRSL